MEFRTKIKLPAGALRIEPSTRILMLGSCFAEHIGQRLVDSKLRCMVNPFGVLYNPASIAQTIDLLTQSTSEASVNQIFQSADGYWYSWQHDTGFGASSREDCEALILKKWREASAILRQTDLVVFTLGTRRVYRLVETNKVVANCLKQPGALFTTEDLTVGDIVSELRQTIEQLKRLIPQAKILFTVSPYRYASYGMHENQLSKASLLLAVDELTKLYPEQCSYFPAYELLMDELRDYRFYAPDMLHPSETAIEYIFSCFAETYFSEATHTFLTAWSEVSHALAHRPFHPESAVYRNFLDKIVLKIKALQEKYPYLALENDIPYPLSQYQAGTGSSGEGEIKV